MHTYELSFAPNVIIQGTIDLDLGTKGTVTPSVGDSMTLNQCRLVQKLFEAISKFHLSAGAITSIEFNVTIFSTHMSCIVSKRPIYY